MCISDLLALHSSVPKGETALTSSFILIHELFSHPDKIFTNYFLQGIKNGSRIGFDRRQYICSDTCNMHIEKLEVVSEYLLREASLNRMWQVPAQRCSHKPFGHYS